MTKNTQKRERGRFCCTPIALTQKAQHMEYINVQSENQNNDNEQK